VPSGRMTISSIGVVGAGVMGTGVALALAYTGHRVILLDVAQAALERVKVKLSEDVRTYAVLSGGRFGGMASDALTRIELHDDYEQLGGADFVIENTTEKWAVKEPVYRKLDAVCPPHVVLAVNTSAIPITRLANLTKRSAKVIGTHFMNPVPLMPTVEVIRGTHTSEQTLATTRKLLAQMGKDAIVVNDSPGFVTNRVMMLMINEAIILLQEGVSSAREIDLLFTRCFGHKMGPLETADLIGLDTVLYSLEVLRENLNDVKFEPCSLLRTLVNAGCHGRKSGEGFFAYPSNVVRRA